MRLKQGAVTPRQRIAATEYARTGSLAYAAHRAGYTHQNGAWRAMQRPAVRQVYEDAQQRLIDEGYAVAVEALIDVARQTKALMPRVAAAKAIANIVDAKAHGGLADLEPYEMTREQLLRKASETAKIVDVLAIQLQEDKVLEMAEPSIFD